MKGRKIEIEAYKFMVQKYGSLIIKELNTLKGTAIDLKDGLQGILGKDKEVDSKEISKVDQFLKLNQKYSLKNGHNHPFLGLNDTEFRIVYQDNLDILLTSNTLTEARMKTESKKMILDNLKTIIENME